jgi:membrane protein YqaA with SNARE-associated domain
MLALSAYLGLFAVAFGAATLLPFRSEPLLVGLLLSGEKIIEAQKKEIEEMTNWVKEHSN